MTSLPHLEMTLQGTVPQGLRTRMDGDNMPFGEKLLVLPKVREMPLRMLFM